LPLLKDLLNDKNDSVKVHAVGSAVCVVKHVKEIAKIQELILPALKQAYQNKTSWRLRFAVAESAALIGQALPKANVDQSILPIYMTLLGDSEPEVRSEAAAKLPQLAKNCSSNLIVSKILPSLKLQLATESS
jgi:HEAT repeat protein